MRVVCPTRVSFDVICGFAVTYNMATKGRVADIRNKFAVRGTDTTGSSGNGRVNGGGGGRTYGTSAAPVSVKENIARYQQQMPLSAQLSRHSAPRTKNYQETDIDADDFVANYSSADRSHFTRNSSSNVVPSAAVRLGCEPRGKSAPISPRRRTDDVTSGRTCAGQTGNGKPVSVSGSGRPCGIDLIRNVQHDKLHDARIRHDVTSSVGNWIDNLSTSPVAGPVRTYLFELVIVVCFSCNRLAILCTANE